MKALKRYLADSGMTQLELAVKVGVKQPAVSNWLSGNKTPSGPHLRIIASRTGLSVDALLGIRRRSR